MKNYFIPYTGKAPAAIVINGHRVVIMSQDKAVLEEDLGVFGADNIKVVRVGDNEDESHKAFSRISDKVKAGVVVAPINAQVKDVIRDLQAELPWLQ